MSVRRDLLQAKLRHPMTASTAMGAIRFSGSEIRQLTQFWSSIIASVETRNIPETRYAATKPLRVGTDRSHHLLAVDGDSK